MFWPLFLHEFMPFLRRGVVECLYSRLPMPIFLVVPRSIQERWSWKDSIRLWCKYWIRIEDAREGIRRRAHLLCGHLYAVDPGIDGGSVHSDSLAGDPLPTPSWLVSSCAVGLRCFGVFLPQLWTMANETESNLLHSTPQSP